MLLKKMKHFKIALLGCGHMGEAILRSSFHNDLQPLHFFATVATEVRRNHLRSLYPTLGLPRSNAWAVERSDLVVLAVKPSVIPKVCEEIQHALNPSVPVISVAAGVRVDRIRSWLSYPKVFRCMPNLPIAHGRGTVACWSDYTLEERECLWLDRLFSPSPRISLEGPESKLDLATAFAGSGPAFWTEMIRLTAQAAIQQGLSEIEAYRLVHATFLGTGYELSFLGIPEGISSGYLKESNEFFPHALSLPQIREIHARLKKSIASKGGTTEAGLKVLTSDAGPSESLHRVYETARKRCEQIDALFS